MLPHRNHLVAFPPRKIPVQKIPPDAQRCGDTDQLVLLVFNPYCHNSNSFEITEIETVPATVLANAPEDGDSR